MSVTERRRSSSEHLCMCVCVCVCGVCVCVCVVGLRAKCINRQLDTPNEPIKRTTRDLRTRVAECAEVEGGILERLL